LAVIIKKERQGEDHMSPLRRTVFYNRHVALNGKMVEFGGWEMPVMYAAGIVEEHLATRKGIGLFDVSHMGRFIIRGTGSLKFLQHALTSNIEALDNRWIGAQYTLIPTKTGGAVDDAFLYRFNEDEYLLVVNAANRLKDWKHLQTIIQKFDDVEMTDQTEEIAMLALQGPESRHLLRETIHPDPLPDPMRNFVKTVYDKGIEVKLSRTGYTGEPVCFELFIPRKHALRLWDRFTAAGAVPVGLGARDTLRLEAGLPLYGHELGQDPDGKEIPILACPTARFAVSFSALKGDYPGREALVKQFNALAKIVARDYSSIADLPRTIQPLAVAGRGIARSGFKVFKEEKQVGYITSGTMVPLWEFAGEGIASVQTDIHQLRSICLAYIDSDIIEDDKVTIEIRNRRVEAVVVPFHLRPEAPPFARPILFDYKLPSETPPAEKTVFKVCNLIQKTTENTVWRQKECMNLIPSEMTASPMVRLLSIMDPSFRYAEHKEIKAFYEADIFYYQGVEFIGEVEDFLKDELRRYLGCREVETRLISGQMANTAVFSAMIDYINRADRKSEQRRLRQVMNNHLGKGGHLSAQPMGALRDFVARDPHTEKPAVVNFPVMPENPYKIDLPKTLQLLDEFKPELIILGKSMCLHKEPVAEIRTFLDSQNIDAVLMYDMAHVLGLIGPHFQNPFAEGVDLVTGSTHKTYFGTQRGIVAGRYEEHEERYALWEALVRRSFPGSVSNHHLGTLLGLLMATYELNHFKDEYQPLVIANAKAFARALFDCGLDVAGDPAIDFTETHQVVVNVGYNSGPETARKLEENNIICNYQATADEEGFTAAGALRMGVAEMTRFGMQAEDFRALAEFMADIIKRGQNLKQEVIRLRQKFHKLQFCFEGEEYDDLFQRLHTLL